MDAKLLTVFQFCQYIGLKKTSAYKLIGEGKVEVARIGRRTLISRESVDRLIASSLSTVGDS